MTQVHAENWIPQGVTELEPHAWEALREVHRSVLVTAGAGAGKTEFLAQKATFLLQTGLCPAPKRLLAISFKRDAARNLTDRVAMRCPPDQARRFNSFTFDAFAKSFVDRFRLALPESFRPPADYRIVRPNRQDYEEFLQRRDYMVISANHLEREIARLPLPINQDKGPVTRAILEYWHSQYNDYDHVLLSFPMINRLVDLILRENPLIKRALNLTYPIVFLDEFQDTTFAQYELLHTAFDGAETVFTAVGDDKQRIMGWAGAMPDAFPRFKQEFGARRRSLVSNWRSHEELVRIQHVIAERIDSNAEPPEARAARGIDGECAAIWEFESSQEESDGLAAWIAQEVASANVEPHELAILVRMRTDEVEAQIAPAFSRHGLRLRNVARNVGDISIQDLLSEDLTQVLLPLLRLGAVDRSPADWSISLQTLQFLEAVDPEDELAMQRLQNRLEEFIRHLRRIMKENKPTPNATKIVTEATLAFLGIPRLRQAFPAYRRPQDFNRVYDGLVVLLHESLKIADTWSAALDEFQGKGQIALMTIHKSKGLEFHTMIFYGLDQKAWWSLKPERPEELNSFFVAFTRAKQRAFFTYCLERGERVAWIEELLAPSGVLRIDGASLLKTPC